MMFKKIVFSLAMMSIAQIVSAANLTLLMTHDSKTVAANGVTSTVHYQERMYRQEQQLWLERVIPTKVYQAKEEHHDGEHKHLDLESSARWITKQPNGASLRLVNRHDKQIVNVNMGDYDAVGFDGKWLSTYSLIDPQQLKTMTLSKRVAPTGSQWYETTKDGRYLRVLWDTKLAIPRRMESGQVDGTQQHTIQIDIQPTTVMPWLALKAYQEKEYSDFLD